ncbi:MAG: hypothetical protein NTZ05_21430 [Chloroflexi bacterium]|nr:hypothetical protein [Chloroflexota bacterium]
MYGYGEKRCDFGVHALWEAQAPEGTGGRKPFPLPGDPPRFSRDRTYDVQHIRIEVALDFAAKQVRGSSTLALAAINDGLRDRGWRAGVVRID